MKLRGDSGNLTSKSGVGEYVPGKGHQVASAGGQGYVYDASGNVVERPGSKLRYDAKGRLRRVELTDGTVVSYRHDHAGRRVVKESAGPKGSHRVVYADRISEERDGQLADYVVAGDVRVARIGGERPTPVALAGLVNGLPPAFGAAALILLALGAASAMARTPCLSC